MSIDLQYFLNQQDELQRVMEAKNGSPHPSDLFTAFDQLPDWINREEAQEEAAAITRFMQWNDKALLHEMVEMESETGWKPWAKGAFVNLEAARGEWIDMLHFMLNGALLLGLNAEDIKIRYDAKHAKNEKRQNEAYDAVSTKCPRCHRALDDDAVACWIDPENHGFHRDPTLAWCAKDSIYYNPTSPEYN